MSNVRGKIFCQRCKTGNELGQDLCARCGTRLMLLVETSTARFEDRTAAAGMEEHLLERVTAIENNISRLIDKLEQMAELMLRGSRSAYIDHALLETLVALLTESGVIDRRRLEAVWRERTASDEAAAESKRRRKEMCEKAVGEYAGAEREQFARLVNEGFETYSKGREAEGVRALERASALASGNLPLDIFLGQHFLLRGAASRSRAYLSRAREASPENPPLDLQLGLACADAGEVARARELLRGAAEKLGRSFAASCALGLLDAFESGWKAALAEFRKALAERVCPEAHYLAGLAQYNLGAFARARAELRRALKLDPKYAAAHYLHALALLNLGDLEGAARAIESAVEAEPKEPRYASARRAVSRVTGRSSNVSATDPTNNRATKKSGGRTKKSGREASKAGVVASKLAAGLPPPTPFGEGARGRRRLLSGGDARLAALLRADALASGARG